MDTPEQPSSSQEQLDQMKGRFVQSLTRGNKKIRADRAVAIAEQAQLKYERKVQDLNMELKAKLRDRENLLDMSPDDTTSLVLASNFNADQFVATDIQLGVDIRNLEIKLEIAEKQYKSLFQ